MFHAILARYFSEKIGTYNLVRFASSISLSAFNKVAFTSKTHPVPPLLTTSWHMIVQTLVSGLFATNIVPNLHYQFMLMCSGGYRHLQRPAFKMPKFSRQWKLILPTSLSTSLDIGLSNMSLKFISLTLYTMTKSITPVWVVILSRLLGVEIVSWRAAVSVLTICAGVGIMVWGHGRGVETQWMWTGIFLLLFATVMSGLRWALTRWILVGKGVVQRVHQDVELDHFPSASTDPVPPHPLSSTPNASKSTSLAKPLSLLIPVPPPALLSPLPLWNPSPYSPLTSVSIMDEADVNEELQSSSLESFKTFSRFETMFILSPINALFLFTMSMVVENPFSLFNPSTATAATHQNIQNYSNIDTFAANSTTVLNSATLANGNMSEVLTLSMIMTTGGLIACVMILSEYWLIELTGVVTLSIAGMVKEILTILFAIIYFGGGFGAGSEGW